MIDAFKVMGFVIAAQIVGFWVGRYKSEPDSFWTHPLMILGSAIFPGYAVGRWRRARYRATTGRY